MACLCTHVLCEPVLACLCIQKVQVCAPVLHECTAVVGIMYDSHTRDDLCMIRSWCLKSSLLLQSVLFGVKGDAQ